jgi:hypothetical protein
LLSERLSGDRIKLFSPTNEHRLTPIYTADLVPQSFVKLVTLWTHHPNLLTNRAKTAHVFEFYLAMVKVGFLQVGT